MDSQFFSIEPNSTPLVGEERRASVRYPCNLQTHCHPITQAKGDRWPTRVVDVSAAGVAISVGRRFEAGAVLSMLLESADGEVSRSLFLRVMHTTQTADGSWRMGCKLIGELGDEELAAFQAKRERPAENDNRAWVRFACNMQVRCRQVAPEVSPTWSSRVMDISPAGMSLVVPRPLEIGALLRVEVPRGPVTAQEITVRIVRRTEHEEKLWLAGCEIIHTLPDEELTNLR
jgi:hypothetical protein